MRPPVPMPDCPCPRRVAAVRPGYVIMDRPLVFPVKTEQGWVGAIHLDWPSIEDSGVEGLTVRFK